MKKALTLLCVAALSAGALAFNLHAPTWGQAQTDQQSPPASAIGTEGSPRPSSAPEHIIYRQFFRHLMALRERADEVEAQGRSGKALRSHYKDKVGLDDRQSRLLEEIAADCDREVAVLDARAKQIIEDAHARLPGGVVPAGQRVPPPPPELKQMQRERESIIMRARHKLRTALGEEGFRQVDDFLKLNFAPNVQPASLRPEGAASLQPGQPGDGR